MKGRTQSRHVPTDRVDELRRQVGAGQQFRKHVEAYWQACEQWADAELDAPEAAAREAAKKGDCKAAFEAEVVPKIEALIAPGAADRLDFEAVETAAWRRALEVAARAVAQRLNADHTGGPLPCHRCGAPARYAGRRAKRFTSVLGELRLERAYYCCDECEAGFCPRDAALGVQGASPSPGVTWAWTARACRRAPRSSRGARASTRTSRPRRARSSCARAPAA